MKFNVVLMAGVALAKSSWRGLGPAGFHAKVISIWDGWFPMVCPFDGPLSERCISLDDRYHRHFAHLLRRAEKCQKSVGDEDVSRKRREVFDIHAALADFAELTQFEDDPEESDLARKRYETPEEAAADSVRLALKKMLNLQFSFTKKFIHADCPIKKYHQTKVGFRKKFRNRVMAKVDFIGTRRAARNVKIADRQARLSAQRALNRA
jgi:hypothetical protein